ncbi:hypothetical protein C5167_004673 [Papaver somniferum]|uniref:Knottin scorpion toxin-like domain-containing protein n=1 Tax=Papaver somniferum TaxID=3469 RepID=A0A4Y7JBI3_PAPSO|nr:hypothetical protein C5167_004673 [Papaver somniferum]
MAKSSPIFSPFFFGLVFLVLIAVISEGGGGVSGQDLYCDPGTGVPREAKSMDYCSYFCPRYCLNTYGNLGVTSGKCFNIPNVNTQLCFCCVVLKS